MTDHCDHKFVDSTSCIKCGWTPPLLNIVRVETEPPDYQADVIMGVGYFRMPSEEAMSDDLQASKAWQDVEQVLQQEPDLHVLKILVADARSADAQQIAALRAELSGIDSLLDRRDALVDVQGRTNKILSIIAAAKSADPKADSIRVVTLTAKNQELEAQLIALQAEHSQWQQLRTAASHALELIASHGGVAPANHMAWDLVYDELTAALAALTAQQEKP